MKGKLMLHTLSLLCFEHKYSTSLRIRKDLVVMAIVLIHAKQNAPNPFRQRHELYIKKFES